MDLDAAMALADELAPSPASAHEALTVLRAALQEARTKAIDDSKTYTSLLWLVSDIRVALGVAGKPMLTELPGLVRDLRDRLAELESAVGSGPVERLF